MTEPRKHDDHSRRERERHSFRMAILCLILAGLAVVPWVVVWMDERAMIPANREISSLRENLAVQRREILQWKDGTMRFLAILSGKLDEIERDLAPPPESKTGIQDESGALPASGYALEQWREIRRRAGAR